MPEATEFAVLFYALPQGHSPFLEWFRGLKDMRARVAIDKRLTRIENGNFGDVKYFESLLELRIDYGPGYRIYCGKEAAAVIVILFAGTKKNQSEDIEKAKRFWRDYQQRSARRGALRGLPPSEAS